MKTKRPKSDPRIEMIDDERDAGNGWLVYLRPGWTIDQLGHTHCFGEDTLRGVARVMKLVQPCPCEECETAKATERTTQWAEL